MRKRHPNGIKLPPLWHQLTVGHFFLWLLQWFYGQLVAADSCFHHKQKGHCSVTKCQDGLKRVLVWSFARWMWKILNLEPKLEHHYLQFSFDLRPHTTEHKTRIDLIFISTLNKIMLLYKHINWCFNYKSISVKTWKNKTVIFTLRNEHLWNVTICCSEKKADHSIFLSVVGFIIPQCCHPWQHCTVVFNVVGIAVFFYYNSYRSKSKAYIWRH